MSYVLTNDWYCAALVAAQYCLFLAISGFDERKQGKRASIRGKLQSARYFGLVWSKYSADRIAGFFSGYMNFRRDPFQPSSLAATFTQMEQVYRAPMDSPTIATGKCHIC